MKDLVKKLRLFLRLKALEDKAEILADRANTHRDSITTLEEMYYHLLNNSNRKMKRKWKRIRRNIPQA